MEINLYSKISLLSVLLLSACDTAPLSITTYSTQSSDVSRIKIVQMEYMLRKGSYCGHILLGKNNFNSDSESIKTMLEVVDKSLNEKVKVKYSISIPDITLEEKVNLGVFKSEDYGFFYEGGYFFHKFSIDTKGITSNRTRAYVTATFEEIGKETSENKYGIRFSEWACK